MTNLVQTSCMYLIAKLVHNLMRPSADLDANLMQTYDRPRARPRTDLVPTSCQKSWPTLANLIADLMCQVGHNFS